jgi:dTDP-4-amino-4,6-dideoxygalactose transaminase
MCGHMGTVALPTNALSVVLAWYPFIRYERTSSEERGATVFVVVVVTFSFIKNVADVLWFGHDPVFI